MSNVKEVAIDGYLPFDYGQNKLVAELIGFIMTPGNGLVFMWNQRVIHRWKNKHGGVTAMYLYSIRGREAVSESYLEKVIKTFCEEGPVTVATYQDIENPDEPLVNLMKYTSNNWLDHFSEIPSVFRSQ